MINLETNEIAAYSVGTAATNGIIMHIFIYITSLFQAVATICTTIAMFPYPFPIFILCNILYYLLLLLHVALLYVITALDLCLQLQPHMTLITDPWDGGYKPTLTSLG